MKDLPIDHVHKATANDALARAIAQALFPDGDLDHEWDTDTTEIIGAALRLWRPDLIPPPRPPLDSYVWSCEAEFDPEPYFRLCHDNSWVPTQEGFKDWVMENLTHRISELTYDSIKENLTTIPSP